jgi:hypothetical protein
LDKPGEVRLPSDLVNTNGNLQKEAGKLKVLGVLIVVVGLIAIVDGLVLGSAKVIKRETDGPRLQSGLTESSVKLLVELVKAPRDKAYFLGGILLVAIGVSLLLVS